MKKLLLFLLLIFSNLAMSYDDYGQPFQGGGSILPDWIGNILGFFFVCWLIWLVFMTPYWIYERRKNRSERKFNEAKMKKALLKVGFPKNKISDLEVSKYIMWMIFIECNHHFQEPSRYEPRAKEDGIETKYVKKLLKLCKPLKHGTPIEWIDS